MDVDYLEELIAELGLDNRDDDDSVVESETEGSSSGEESDNEDENCDELGFKTKPIRSGSNRFTANDTLQHLINNVLTDEQRQALRRGECFFCQKTGHFYWTCPRRKEYLKRKGKTSMASGSSKRSSKGKQSTSKTGNKPRTKKGRKKESKDPNVMVYNIEDEEDVFGEYFESD